MPDVQFWDSLSPDQLLQLEREEAAVLYCVNGFLVQESLQPLSYLAQLYADVDANFLLTFAELDHYPRRPGATYWGMWSPAEGMLPEWPDGQGPRIFAYLKPMAPLQRLVELLRALAGHECPCLVVIVGANVENWRQFETKQLRIVSEPLDICDVAAECDLAVLNGNAGTATKLLLSGIPQLHIPIYLEQAVFSKLVERIGAGLTVFQDQPEQFAAGLATILNDGRYRDAAQAFAQRYTDYSSDEAKQKIVNQIAELPA
jgi:UDP:flavonoid glycosyltransferase YjiC (YdhE family)